jgi:MFS family permease
MLRLPAFPPLVWVLLGGVFLTRTAFFMVWPFLIVILDRDFGLSPVEVGAILAASGVGGAVMGFYAGNLSDRFGRRNVMIAGSLGTIAAYVLLAMGDTVFAYTFGAFLVGFCRIIVEAPASALIADAITDLRLRELAFHARYFLLNVGAAIGPLLVFQAGLAAETHTFWITALAYALFILAILFAFHWAPPPRVPKPEHHDMRFAAAIHLVAADRPFLFLLLANFLSYAAYVQWESTLIQYLSREGGGSVLGLITALIVTNALTIVIFQFPLLRLLRRFDLYIRTFVGLAFAFAGFIAYMLLPVRFFAAWIAATFVLSLGEAILFPTLNLQTDRLAPAHLRGTYFGAASFSSLGFAAGPLAGGAALQYLGGPTTFLLTAGMLIASALSYRASARRAPSRRDAEATRASA